MQETWKAITPFATGAIRSAWNFYSTNIAGCMLYNASNGGDQVTGMTCFDAFGHESSGERQGTVNQASNCTLQIDFLDPK